MLYKLLKVFDCQQMPEDIKYQFFDATSDYLNDVYLEWYWEEMNPEVDKWLLENGANPNEQVLIKRWW